MICFKVNKLLCLSLIIFGYGGILYLISLTSGICLNTFTLEDTGNQKFSISFCDTANIGDEN